MLRADTIMRARLLVNEKRDEVSTCLSLSQGRIHVFAGNEPLLDESVTRS